MDWKPTRIFFNKLHFNHKTFFSTINLIKKRLGDARLQTSDDEKNVEWKARAKRKTLFRFNFIIWAGESYNWDFEI